jgi:hypothetical protein
MARGPSGRIVVEVDPSLKKRLHAALTLDGTNLKKWFQQQAEAYLAGHSGLAKGSSGGEVGTQSHRPRGAE